jgi:excisionase family DNA binding protein
MQIQSANPSGPYAWLLARTQKQQPMRPQPPLPEDRFAAMLSTAEVSRILNCCPTTVRRMLARGDLRGTRFQGRRGRFRVPRSEVQRLSALPKDQK